MKTIARPFVILRFVCASLLTPKMVRRSTSPRVEPRLGTTPHRLRRLRRRGEGETLPASCRNTAPGKVEAGFAADSIICHAGFGLACVVRQNTWHGRTGRRHRWHDWNVSHEVAPAL